MAFQSLHHVLQKLEHRVPPQERQLQSLMGHWPEIVGSVVAAQTRPLSIQRGVLQVATASSAWAQNLVFERQRILDKLNTQLGISLRDIRFSPAQWDTSVRSAVPGTMQQEQIWQNHPSRLKDGSPLQQPRLASDQQDDPVRAFKRWSAVIQKRAQQLPLCPQCQSPTPQGELERWTVCSLCVAKRW
jgi:predicted nucleic acid-binding Zn ribbon protein